MANTGLSLNLSCGMTGTLTGPTGVYSTPTVNMGAQKQITFSLGTGANQADLVCQKSGTVNSTGSNVDLSGSLTDDFGATMSFVEIAVLMIENTSATDTLVVGGAATNGFATPFAAANDAIVLKPGGVLLLASGADPGYVVTASTGDQLKLAAGTTSADYKLVAIGRSA